MISACIVSPAWGRFDVTRLVLEQRQRLCAELASRGIDAVTLIVADDENLDIAVEYGCGTIEHANDPNDLGQRVNPLFVAAVATGADWIVWVGSDDWIHSDAFDPLHIQYEKPVIIRGKRLAMVDLTTGVLQQIGSPSAYGAIPWFIDRRLFMVTQIRPIQRELQRGLDGALIRGLRRHNIPFELVTHDPHAFRCVDFKSPANLSPFYLTAERLAGEQPEQTLDALQGWFPDDLIAKARALSEVNC